MTEAGGDLGWRAALPPDLQSHELLTPIKEVKDLGASYVDLTTKYNESGKKVQDLEGRMKDALFVPGSDAKPEDIAAFRTKLGVPEKPEAYEFDQINFPEGIIPDPTMEKWFRGIAHQTGLSKDQAKSLHGLYAQAYIASEQARTEARKEAIKVGLEKLNKEWGAAHKENLALAERVVNRFGSDDIKALLKETKLADGTILGDHPAMIKMMYEIGKVSTEDVLKSGDPSSQTTQASPGMFQYPSMANLQK